MVVQERQSLVNLAQMADVDKARFLDAPVSQVGLFGDTVEDFAQQFSAVQKQSEAISHILPRRGSTKPSSAKPPAARRRGDPPAAAASARPLHHRLRRDRLSLGVEATRRKAAQPVPQRPAKTTRKTAKRPDTGNPEMRTFALRGTTTSVPPAQGRAGPEAIAAATDPGSHWSTRLSLFALEGDVPVYAIQSRHLV
ncbi:hypothetical protein QQF64_025983 [Cirrhinus molitorella]|uniref:Uncharacterized protein n=1 Tax=Cirrhinus molitorella TaxID=172907 RepID=A0ABR3NS03_9TELE